MFEVSSNYISIYVLSFKFYDGSYMRVVLTCYTWSLLFISLHCKRHNHLVPASSCRFCIIGQKMHSSHTFVYFVIYNRVLLYVSVFVAILKFDVMCNPLVLLIHALCSLPWHVITYKFVIQKSNEMYFNIAPSFLCCSEEFCYIDIDWLMCQWNPKS